MDSVYHSVQGALDWLKRFDRFHVRPGLERMEVMLDALGRPEQGLRFIHLAGTNGKGSTGAFIARILREHGFNVGVFSSPAISHELDRIKYNDCRMTDDLFLRCVARMKPVIDQLEDVPTEFEVTTALAIGYFAVRRPDWVIWETGLGGRFDSTNVVQPVVSIITNIGYDHTEILGGTLEAIAFEKAGIVKEGRPVVTGVRQPGALKVIKARAQALHAPLYTLEQCVRWRRQAVERDGQMFSYSGLSHSWDALAISLRGSHQLENATLALLALEVIAGEGRLKLAEDAVRRGLKETRWPGRLELVCEMPPVLLDAAHNGEAARRLVEALHDHFTYERLHFVFASFRDKPVREVAKTVGQLADEIIVTAGRHPRYIPAGQLAKTVQEVFPSKRVTAVTGPQQAVQQALANAGPNDLVLVAGSHDLISVVRGAIPKEGGDTDWTM